VSGSLVASLELGFQWRDEYARTAGLQKPVVAKIEAPARRRRAVEVLGPRCPFLKSRVVPSQGGRIGAFPANFF